MTSAVQWGPFYIGFLDVVFTLLCLGLAVGLGSMYGKRLARQGLTLDTALQSGPRPWFFLGGFLALCALIALCYKLPPGYMHPLWLGYLEPLSWALTKGAPVFLAAMAFALKPRTSGPNHEPKILGVLALIAVVGIQAIQSPFMRPLDAKTIQVRVARDGSILQSTNVTCTAASLANGLAFYNIHTTEAESAAVLGTRRSGTALHQVIAGAPHYGVVATAVQATPRQLVQMQRPTLVSVWLMGDILHSILVYGGDERGNVYLIDPMSGKATYSPKHYLKQVAREYQLVLTREPVPEVTAQSSAADLLPLQKALQAQGFDTPQNGQWDTAFTQAIQNFQTHYALPVTGKMDPLTWLVLTGPTQGIKL